ncbi:MAG: tRNA glutamyl-Q(34) synthetase GluQRS [Acidocella sp. 20-57-95]|nr:MAG: tRNA glutamyl-Q(34) synthetase GluQRS [Acidocella sp. 20-57-95]OYV58736.1 MAG: tRNA glutamyl-Q(34) synthetase GluQRS [Acidocella sp. 21-58-7]HQT63642.1 tRNA glutamyl-Q(34) synthetase GluQRS [Acidocella sp.]HQU04060.1 tRNA glutamyl-Q(34) synthetase GluQRS [Acidocella sp.]
MTITTRFAPSPTGYLHLGHAYAAHTAWAKARAAHGKFLLRLEDIDRTRCKPAFAAAILEDLRWLGLSWDGAVRVQSAHLADYSAALARLEAGGLLYPCFCTRSEIARAQTAPHDGEPVYPGTCRGLSIAERTRRIAHGQKYARRLDVTRAMRATGALRFFEEGSGWVDAQPAALGDVVLARNDIPTSYHLCVVHDDALQGVTHVTRGEDLFSATHIHVLLQSLLGLPMPVYTHHKLLTDETGKRLAKRDAAPRLRTMREAGATPDEVLAQLQNQPAASHSGVESGAA